MEEILDVVMLPTEKAGPLVINMAMDNKLVLNTDNQTRLGTIQPQHLYLVSKKELINNGDWFISGITGRLMQHADTQFSHKDDAKVIATGNEVLIVPSYIEVSPTHKRVSESGPVNKLPHIPQSFIRAYAEANGKIDKVRVETKCGKLNLRYNNTVRIIPITKKYSEDEMFMNMQYYYEYVERNGYVTPMEWLTEHKHF